MLVRNRTDDAKEEEIIVKVIVNVEVELDALDEVSGCETVQEALAERGITVTDIKYWEDHSFSRN